jgi:hypothetical protein
MLGEVPTQLNLADVMFSYQNLHNQDQRLEGSCCQHPELAVE